MEAQEVGRNQRADSKNITDLAKTQAQVAAKNLATQSVERYKLNHDKVLAGDIASKAADRIYKQEAATQMQAYLNKVYPGFAGLPKENQAFLLYHKLKEDAPEGDWEDMLQSRVDITNATKPNPLSVSLGINNENSDNFFKNLKGIRDASKFPPVAGGSSATPSRRLVDTEGTDIDGNIIHKFQGYNPKTNSFEAIPNAPEKFDPNVQKIDAAANIGKVQGLDGYYTVLNQMAKGTDKQMLGALAGNGVAKWARSMGWKGDGKFTAEALIDLSTKNLALQHTKTMFGGRYPIQAANELEKTLGGRAQTPESLARGLAGLVMSIDIMQMVNSRQISRDDANDPRFTEYINKAIDKNISGARDMKVVGKLPDIRAILKQLHPTAPADKAAAKFGLDQ